MVKKSIEERGKGAISITEKVAFLKDPASYPHPVKSIETKETHMSWVFLVDGFAYKLKKPVKYRFLDFRILDARFRNCREEVRLNRRLAADIYIGIIPLLINEKGKLALQGKGTIIDWLVKMKRIPEENMLDQAIRNHTVNETTVRQVAVLLATFYQRSPGIAMAPAQYLQKLRGEVQVTCRELVNPLYQLPAEEVSKVTESLLHFLARQSSMFEKRVTDGKIIEAHGDLRPEHICLGTVPAVIDCLEFNRELRVLDIAEELSFLAMECEILGDFTTGNLFLETYSSLAADRIPASLIIFYKMKKALLRVYLVVRHIAEPAYKDDPKWLTKANTYLQMAEKYCTELIGIE